MTLYRYFCMATLTITHRVPEETVVDFKVTHSNVPSSRFLFPSNFDSARFELFVFEKKQVKKAFPRTGFHSLAFRFPPTVVRCLLHGHQAALPDAERGSSG
jgi:hypothetical protein